ncbi:MAG: DUF2064 domain-containing protein [Lewinellaceae bacterium]|nr:DUF2064 domain-containing protein [Phaeodactylibacter sp.]MCB9042065.1 DUF2064 domain-containing protein [Lewinellaceae bacterium]
MKALPQDIAILLFLRSEAEEALAKPLAGGGPRINKAIYKKLNQHAQRQARLSGLPLVVVRGSQQSGATFGERLANAFEHAFAQGYSRIIAIGNDCLALNADRLREAAARLEYAGAVLGPARDGGVYLLGLSRRAYNRSLFLGLPWQTGQLSTALCQYAVQLNHIPLLMKEEEDADDVFSFRRLAGRLSSRSPLCRYLENLLHSAFQPHCSLPALLLNEQHHAYLKRGPPARF